MLWLRGDGNSFLITASEAGNLRRIHLDPGAPPSTLLSHVVGPFHGLLCLCYSDALKLVGYSSGNGDAAVLACIARMPAQYYFSSKASVWSRFVPRAMLVSSTVQSGKVIKVKWGSEQPCSELYEAPRGAVPWSD